MYIRKASLKNVRSISEMEWAVREGEEAGWHVILGDNGSGKSSFLRALALGLVGPRNAEALRLDWNQWITRGTDFARIELQVAWDARDSVFRIRKRDQEPVAHGRAGTPAGKRQSAGGRHPEEWPPAAWDLGQLRGVVFRLLWPIPALRGGRCGVREPLTLAAEAGGTPLPVRRELCANGGTPVAAGS